MSTSLDPHIEPKWDSLKTEFHKMDGDPVKQAEWLGEKAGRVIFEVGSTVVPVTKLGLIGKVADGAADLVRVAGKLDNVADQARVASKIDDASNAGRVATKAPLTGDALKAETLATVGKSIAAAKAVRAMSPAAAREFLLSIDNFAARENILRTLVSDPKLLDISTPANKATFYSGRVELKPGEFLKARDWAESLSGRTTLEQTSGGRWLDQVKTYDDVLSRPVADEVWTTLSRRYADNVSGEVVVVKGDMRSNAVLHAELKILEAAQQSGKITSLKIIDLQTVVEKLSK